MSAIVGTRVLLPRGWGLTPLAGVVVGHDAEGRAWMQPDRPSWYTPMLRDPASQVLP